MRGFFMPKNKSLDLTFSIMSIAKAQAEALAEGFLDGLGTSKSGLRPKKTYSELILLAAELVEEAQNNLNKSNAIASGNLSDSIVALEPTVNGGVFSIDVEMNFYGQFIDKGVKGTRGGTGLYQFRNENPSPDHVSAMKEWLRQAGSKVRSVKKSSPYGGLEKKNKSLEGYDDAYALARSIKIKGIRPRNFMTNAAASTASKVADRLGAAFKIDVLNSITS